MVGLATFLPTDVALVRGNGRSTTMAAAAGVFGAVGFGMGTLLLDPN
jgi:hypothetical protein